MYNNKCDLNHIKVFGCLCFNSTLTSNRRKLNSHLDQGVCLGFKNNIKGYVVYNLKTYDIIVSRNVIVYKDIFSYSKQHDKANEHNQVSFFVFKSL